MVDALNDWAKVYGVDTTFEKGDEKLQRQVNALAEIVNEAGKDIGSEDVKNLEDVYDAVMNNVSDGDIILMHEIYESTADAFEKMVPELIKQGYQFVTCDELIRAKTGSAPTAGTQYVDGKTVNNETS